MEERFTRTDAGLQDVDERLQDRLNSVFDLEPHFSLSPLRTAGCGVHNSRRILTLSSALLSIGAKAVSRRFESDIVPIDLSRTSPRGTYSKCPNLEVLCVKYCPKVTYDSMWDIALKCPKLKELDISCSYEISCECVKMLGTNCKNLEILKWSLLDPLEITELKHTRFVPRNYLEKPSIMTLGNLQVSYIRRHMHQLRHLELRFSTLNDKGLANLCKACSKLEYLDLFGCKNLTSVGVTTHTSTLKNLKEVNFFFLV
ncbi:unnamed protein product [Microthlaspi erraticum]|uniref:Uncharacterized protein n=1 Tax=Microthlaspi erraticum TaxID=1685480 RepID=A0A6D2K6Q0_9BRAS|nr:unnamed protein product [Microthlaspi erraticum]